MTTKKTSSSSSAGQTKKFKGPMVLVILDGWGITSNQEGNAVTIGKTPVMDELAKNYPSTLLTACGKRVGLPHNQKGNSEAGHMNLGAGRVAEQDVVRISNAIENKTFFKNTAFNSVINNVKKNKSAVHLLGLLSGVESAHVEMPHLYALLKLLKQKNVDKVFIHFFTDGRDAPQHEALKFIKKFKDQFVGNEKIASI